MSVVEDVFRSFNQVAIHCYKQTVHRSFFTYCEQWRKVLHQIQYQGTCSTKKVLVITFCITFFFISFVNVVGGLR